MSEKSIVVFNTPTKCKDCYFNGYRWDVCILVDEDIDEYVNPNETKPEWCPLRPLPKPITEYEVKVSYDYDPDYAQGFNDCLNEIVGEQNESNIST